MHAKGYYKGHILSEQPYRPVSESFFSDTGFLQGGKKKKTGSLYLTIATLNSHFFKKMKNPNVRTGAKNHSVAHRIFT